MVDTEYVPGDLLATKGGVTLCTCDCIRDCMISPICMKPHRGRSNSITVKDGTILIVVTCEGGVYYDGQLHVVPSAAFRRGTSMFKRIA